MIKEKIVVSKTAYSQRLKSFRTRAALILGTIMLFAAAATVTTAQTYTDLYNFDGTNGSNPPNMGTLAQGRDGNLYGTTSGGGANNYGVVFKITPSGMLKVLYNFDGAHGSGPNCALTLGTDGNFYGTTQGGGDNGYGTIFKITKSGTLTTLYSFTVGASPFAPPIQGTDGNFYGTYNTTVPGGGTYKITPSGTVTLLAPLPEESYAPLLLGTDGNFYGTTLHYYSNEGGTAFKMTPTGIVTILYSFSRYSRPGRPYGPLIQGSDGNFYGTTLSGGQKNGGVVFKLTPQGAITVLHNFGDIPNDGINPFAGVVEATDGNFYGVAYTSGAMNGGVLFQITPAGAYSILHNFGDIGYDGVGPAPLMQHTSGKIYGLTSDGGTYNYGVVYSLDIGPRPFVKLVSTIGKVGRIVEVIGQGLKGTTAVSFNGTPATFTIVCDTYLVTNVPSGATTGFVDVTTPGGTLQSNQRFNVTPVIQTFSPTSGPAGTAVTITGNSLTQTTQVAFWGILSPSFTVDSDTQVTATVPAGAKPGKIAITTAGGKTWSPVNFTVTP